MITVSFALIMANAGGNGSELGLSEPCPVGGWKGLDRAYYRTHGSLTMTYGGTEGKEVDSREGVRRRRPVLRSILKLGD